MRADLLLTPVDGVADAMTAVDGFDAALVGGLLRPQAGPAAAVAGLADAVAGTPLASRAAEAAEKVAVGAAGDNHFAGLAGARAALLGAVHDALVCRVDEATGRSRLPWTAPPPAEPHAPNLRAAARSWLADLARAGWQGITHDLVAGSAQVVAAMLPDPALRRLAVLLDGFAAELAAYCPGADLEHVPERRWADLWTRATLLAQPGAADAAPDATVTGRVLPLGVDLQEHTTAAQAQVHAVFEPADGGPARLVRASVAVAKPDTVVGMGVWQLLRPHLSLLMALVDGHAMNVVDLPMTASGDLLWDPGCATTAAPADALTTARVALADVVPPAFAPLDRHPVAIAEPVFLHGYRARRDGDTITFDVAGTRLPLTVDRLPAASPLTPELVAKSTACLGLLRWDAGEFAVQPLAVETVVKKKPVTVHTGAWAGGATAPTGAKAEKAAAEAVAVLRERAGRLLRG